VKDSPATAPLNLKEIFDFELDDFQLKAIAALAAGKSVVVCAPTGSGKTVIGEYAIYRALSRGKRVFYTTPLKALSNQKFRDFLEKFGQKSASDVSQEVGLITGDILINPNALIVVMTTEIFRNMLYETPIGQVGTSLEAVETVVLDECHYISDRGRGTVWEESIIYCPPSIQLVALSASIGNPEELTDWINQVRTSERKREYQSPTNLSCELINSDFRPVPLRFYFSCKEGLFPLLNNQQTKVNPRLLSKRPKGERRRFKREDCPGLITIVKQLWERDMLPAIYVIFSRRGCDQAVQSLYSLTLVNEQEAQALQFHLLSFFLAENPYLQEQLLSFFREAIPDLHSFLLDFLSKHPEADIKLLQFLAKHPEAKAQLFQFLAEQSEFARYEQLEPLLHGIAAHHAGVLPVWKELVEQLFELGLVKVVFATATLSAGINMPARTTVISALSKRTDDGHSMLTPSEFLQIAGRAGRRGMDSVGHVVTIQTPFEGAMEAAYLATSTADPLKSCFTPSYGMVLNLLQKYTIAEAKDLLERSFAEYLAQLKLVPEQQAIAALTTELAKLDVELASIDIEKFTSYEKLKERLKEEERCLKILQQQAEINRKQEITALLTKLVPGSFIALKGKHIKVASPLTAILVTKIPGSGQAENLVCLGRDNRWYIATQADAIDILPSALPLSEFSRLSLPDLELAQLGQWHKGDAVTANVSQQIPDYRVLTQPAPEVVEQYRRVEQIQVELDHHPLQQQRNPGRLIKLHKHRLELRNQLHKSQRTYQKHQSRKSYYWEEFLNLIEILREFGALEDFTPTSLGEAAAAMRGENELWLGLALMSGELACLSPPHLAAAVCALITETPRPDSWTNYPPPQEVLAAFQQTEWQTNSLREIRRQLFQLQKRCDITIPVWLESKFIGLVEQWTLGLDWNELCENTNLDEGDIVRLLRRTIDILWQIPHVPGISDSLRLNAKMAIAQMKRFPI
jgi:superfamily II RNA helicase